MRHLSNDQFECMSILKAKEQPVLTCAGLPVNISNLLRKLTHSLKTTVFGVVGVNRLCLEKGQNFEVI
jgi:hypothetical protein